ncbi:hypothetical protein GGI02_001292 [Coemansia sp. RSA 2322]|nr:hypothetical protein GGI02_001292 [Coemansia sp. RSA 2322]
MKACGACYPVCSLFSPPPLPVYCDTIEASNDPREFLAAVGDDDGADEDEMENEFGGAGTYNQELQSVFQEMLTNLLGRPITDPASTASTDTTGATHREGEDAAAAAQFSGQRTWTSNLGNGGTVSFSVSNYSPTDFAAAAADQRRMPSSAASSANNQSDQQQQGRGEHPRRPMFIDPEENAPITLGNVMASLLGALGGNLRGEGGVGGVGGPIFNLPMGNLGDYVWGQNSLDDIITQIMEQNQGAHAPPPASQETILKLPKRAVTSEELQRNLDCGICMEEYKPEEHVVELPCKHAYHKDCIEHWLGMNGTCPICRAAIEARSDGSSGGATSRPPPPAHSELPGSYPSSPAAPAMASHQETSGGRDDAASASVSLPTAPAAAPEPEPTD